MSRWLATEGNVKRKSTQIKTNWKCFDTVVLDNQDLILRLSTVTPAGSPAGRSIVVVQNTHSARELPLHRKWCR